MKPETTLNFTDAQLNELKRLVDVVGWSTRNDETGHIDTCVSEDRVRFARQLAGILNQMDALALVGTKETNL